MVSALNPTYSGKSTDMDESQPKKALEPTTSDALRAMHNIDLNELPEVLRKRFARYDRNGNGVLDPDELPIPVDDNDNISLKAFPPVVRKNLAVFDKDGDGTVNTSELIHAAQMYEDSRNTSRKLTYALIAATLACLAMFACNTAATFMVVELAKETSTDDSGVMKVKGTDTVVETGANLQGTKLHSGLPNAAFKELRYFEATSDTGAYMQIAVNGFVRIPGGVNAAGRLPNITTIADSIMLLTPYGGITMTGSELSFDSEVPDVFLYAGFRLDSKKRKLLGIAELVGFFNKLSAWKDANPDSSVQVPVLNPQAFTKSRTYVRCGELCVPYPAVDPPGSDSWDGPGPELDAQQNELIGVVMRGPNRFTYYDEDGWAFTAENGVQHTKAVKTFPRWPSIHVVEIENSTHRLTYQLYDGKKFHCELDNLGVATESQKEARDKDMDPNNFQFLGDKKYVFERPENGPLAAGTQKQEFLTKHYVLKAPSVNLEEHYYGHAHNINIPIALRAFSMDAEEPEEVLAAEYDFYAVGENASIAESMFDIVNEMADCLTSATHIPPPDIYAQLIGATVVPTEDDWGRNLTAEEIEAYRTRAVYPTMQMSAEEQVDLTQYPVGNDALVEGEEYDSASSIEIDDEAFELSELEDALEMQASIGGANVSISPGLLARHRRRLLKTAANSDIIDSWINDMQKMHDAVSRMADEKGIRPKGAHQMQEIYEEMLMQKMPHGGKLFVDPDTGYVNVVDHEVETPHPILAEHHFNGTGSERRALMESRRREMLVSGKDIKKLYDICGNPKYAADNKCCKKRKILSVDIAVRTCAACKPSGGKPSCKVGTPGNPKHPNKRFALASYQSPKIYWPSGLGLFQIYASAQMKFDPMRYFSNSPYPEAQGCINFQLACKNMLTKKGFGFAASFICPAIHMSGRICVKADTYLNSRCVSGYKNTNVAYNENYCCSRHWLGWCTRTCSRRKYRTEKRPVHQDFNFIARLGVFGEIVGGINIGIAGITAKAKAAWYGMAENPLKFPSSLKGKMGGSHLGIYVKLNGWVPFHKFDASFHAFPWGGDTSCSARRFMLDGEVFERIGF